MSWFKRYAIGCLISLFVFAALDGYSRSDEKLEVGPIVALAVLWPVAAAVFVDSCVNEFVKEAAAEKPKLD
jgi:hypothetical protein